jgi:hypothetical protein
MTKARHRFLLLPQIEIAIEQVAAILVGEKTGFVRGPRGR